MVSFNFYITLKLGFSQVRARRGRVRVPQHHVRVRPGGRGDGRLQGPPHRVLAHNEGGRDGEARVDVQGKIWRKICVFKNIFFSDLTYPKVSPTISSLSTVIF